MGFELEGVGLFLEREAEVDVVDDDLFVPDTQRHSGREQKGKQPASALPAPVHPHQCG